jgi:hypothetical protein
MADQIADFLGESDAEKRRKFAESRMRFQQSLKDIPEPSFLDDMIYGANVGGNVNALAQYLRGAFYGPGYSDPFTSMGPSPTRFMGPMPTQTTMANPSVMNAFVFNPQRSFPRYEIASDGRFAGDLDYINNDPAGYLVNGRYTGFR